MRHSDFDAISQKRGQVVGGSRENKSHGYRKHIYKHVIVGTVGTDVGTIVKHVGTVGTVGTNREIISYYSSLQFPRFPQFPRVLQWFPHQFARLPHLSYTRWFMLWSTLPRMLSRGADKRSEVPARAGLVHN